MPRFTAGAKDTTVPKRDTDPDVQEIFDEAQAKADKPGATQSRDVEADKRARRAKASLDDAYLRYVEAGPGAGAPDRVAAKVWQMAELGNMDAIKHLNQRVDGNIPQRQELTGAEGGPILIDKPLSEMTDDELHRIANAGQG